MGLIPARAGNTPSRTTKLRNACGSSPLARGTRQRVIRQPRLRGLIPARAGNTPGLQRASGANGAHPRSRGEHLERRPGAAAKPGSSPLARGTQSMINLTGANLGLIPARAGNTSWTGSRRTSARAHPRSRGEHATSQMARPSSPGSSPLARGTLSNPLCRVGRIGLIPARAGNTF